MFSTKRTGLNTNLYPGATQKTAALWWNRRKNPISNILINGRFVCVQVSISAVFFPNSIQFNSTPATYYNPMYRSLFQSLFELVWVIGAAIAVFIHFPVHHLPLKWLDWIRACLNCCQVVTYREYCHLLHEDDIHTVCSSPRTIDHWNRCGAIERLHWCESPPFPRISFHTHDA